MRSQDSDNNKPRCFVCGEIIPASISKFKICVRCLSKNDGKKERVEAYEFGRKSKSVKKIQTY